METVSKIRMAKNEVNRTLLCNVTNNSTLFHEKISELISKTPTGNLRNTYTELNILFQNIESNYENLIKLYQI